MGDLASKIILGSAVADGWTWQSLFLVASSLQMTVAVLNVMLLPRHVPAPPPAPEKLEDQQQKRRGTLAFLASLSSSFTTSSSSSSAPSVSGAGSLLGEEQQALGVSTSGTTDPSSPPLSYLQIKMIVFSPRFFSLTLAIAALHIVMEFDKYIPLYLHKSLHLPPGLAAQGAALYPFSQLLALGLAGVTYDRLTARGRLITISTLCFCVFVFYSLQVLFRVWTVPTANAAYLVLIFCAGFCVAVPYYLPPSIFLAEVGGKGKCTSFKECRMHG